MKGKNMRKILSVDGGGIKGIFAASFLAEIEQKCSVKICDYFDILAGTSTGGIITAALSVGIPAKDILELYMENAKCIFPQNKYFKLFKTKYRSKFLEPIIAKALKDLKIRDCKTRLLIPAYNLEQRSARVFKTPHTKDLYFDKDILLKDIVMATTAAPLYFPPYKMEGGTFIDGGVIANNPSFMAVAEGMTRLQWKKEEIVLLSIGGVEDMPRTTGKENMGLMNALKIQKCFMGAGNQYSENLCKIFLQEENFFRINYKPLDKQVSLDKVEPQAIRLLNTWGRNAAQTNTSKIKEVFLAQKKGKFQLYNL